MAGSLIDRFFGIIELLAVDAPGVSLTKIADELDIPKSAAHRLLSELIRLGYVRQDSGTERYQLTTKLLSLSFKHLSSTGLVDFAQPILEQLAYDCGELARLAVVDGENLTWVAKAQGVRSGLRYDPDMGAQVPLFCTATGQAWLSTMPETTAVAIVARQGFGRLNDHGPNAPRTIEAFVDCFRVARQQGYAFQIDSGGLGTSALACAIKHPKDDRAIGVVAITGPSARLTQTRMLEFAPRILSAAAELSTASTASDYLLQAERPGVAVPRN